MDFTKVFIKFKQKLCLGMMRGRGSGRGSSMMGRGMSPMGRGMGMGGRVGGQGMNLGGRGGVQQPTGMMNRPRMSSRPPVPMQNGKQVVLS